MALSLRPQTGAVGDAESGWSVCRVGGPAPAGEARAAQRTAGLSEAKVRIDVWLWRARFAKTRSIATQMVLDGAVRLIRPGQSRVLDKASVAVGPGDVLTLAHRGGLKMVRIEALGVRRGPPAEARALYCDLEAEPNADIGGLA